jgi:hypothetical protein
VTIVCNSNGAIKKGCTPGTKATAEVFCNTGEKLVGGGISNLAEKEKVGQGISVAESAPIQGEPPGWRVTASMYGGEESGLAKVPIKNTEGKIQAYAICAS